MEQDKAFLGKEPIGKLLLKLALPTVAAQMINIFSAVSLSFFPI